MNDKVRTWNGGLEQDAVDLLVAGGGLIVTPTKVGYIIMTSDGAGLERKFEAKERKRNKPGVVLCGSLEQLRELAELNPEIDAFYQKHWDQDILLGCILPWRKDAIDRIPDDGSRELAKDGRDTSCFVIKFGVPGELIARELWNTHGKFAFASSANPSGKGNRGLVEGIGERIHERADMIIEGNAYVASIQPNSDERTRYEQGVMVSMVDDQGRLIPEQKGQRQITPAPVVIRKGLDIDRIMSNLADSFPSWDYRHGQYY